MHSRQNTISKYLPGVWVLVLLAVVAVCFTLAPPKGLSLSPSTVHASGGALTGYAWSDNIGWISFSGTAADSSAYGVTVGSGGTLTGYAWSDNIGWINFGANSCGAQATMTAGALSGWAQAPAATGGWDGCISLSGASPAYGVVLSGTTFTGFGWGSDVVGWLSFSGTATDGSPYAVTYSGAGAPTCTLSVAPNPVATNSSITLNYTTTGSPTTGTIKDSNNTIITSSATNSSGGVSSTAPSSSGSYTYTMTVSSPSGSGSCQSTLQAQTDVCTDIPGIQSSAPASPCVTPSPTPGACVPGGYTWNGSACVVVPPSITAFSGPTRVRSGSSATLTYNVTNPPASCSITGSNGYNSGPFTPTSGVQGQVTTTAITANTIFTLACNGVSKSINVGTVPVFKEI
jgi:hypothetical protein